MYTITVSANGISLMGFYNPVKEEYMFLFHGKMEIFHTLNEAVDRALSERG